MVKKNKNIQEMNQQECLDEIIRIFSSLVEKNEEEENDEEKVTHRRGRTIYTMVSIDLKEKIKKHVRNRGEHMFRWAGDAVKEKFERERKNNDK